MYVDETPRPDTFVGASAGSEGPPAGPKYWAFISYSHRDRHWGEWLHLAIEAYRVPRKLVGRLSPEGSIPRRLMPIFRDCAELPAAANLGARLEEALQRSRYLIVVCSPAAAASRWVNEEIQTFIAAGRDNRVLCLIVDGEPHASAWPEGKEYECFPEALCMHVLPKGEVAEAPAEPLAAAVRPGHDNKTTAKLRLIAGLIGVSFEELQQRERRRRRWRLVQLTLLALLVVAAIGGVWQWQEIQKQQQQRRQAIENFINVGQMEVHNGNLLTAAVYLNEAYKLGDDSLRLRYLLARALPAIDIQLATLQGSGPPVVAAAFDQQGRYLLSLSQPAEVKVWNVAAGQLIGTLAQHRALISSASFSHDGKHIVTTSYDRTTKIWEASTARLVHSLEGHTSLLETALYSPDDTLLLTLGVDATARLWDPVAGKLLRALEGGARKPVAFSPNGSRLVTTQVTRNGKHLVLLQDTDTGRLIRIMEGHQSTVHDARFSPHGTRIVTASTDGSLRIWHGERGDLLTTWTGGAGPLVFAAFLPDDRTVVVLAESGTVYRYDAEAQQLLDHWQTGLRPVQLAAFDPTRGWLALIGPEGILTVWDTQSGSLLAKLEGHKDKTLCAAINPAHAPHVVTGAADGAVVTWDLSRRATSFSLPGHGQMVNVARFSPDGKWILTAGSNAVATIWHAESGIPVATLHGHAAAVTQAKFDPTGSRVVTLSLDGAMGWWSATDWQLLYMVQDAKIQQAEFSPDGQRVLLILGGRYAALLDAASRRIVATVNGRMGLRSGAFSPDGHLLAIGSEDGTVDLRDARTGTPIRLMWAHAAVVHSLQFNADSSRLLSASADGSAVVWAVPQGEVLASLKGHTDAVVSARFSPDSSRVVTASLDKSAKIWSAIDGRLIASLNEHQAGVSSAQFSPDGKLVATSSDDRTVKNWDAVTGQLLQSLEGHDGEVLAVAFRPDGERLIAGAKGPLARVWDVRLEQRSSHEVDALIRRRVPRWLPTVTEAAAAMGVDISPSGLTTGMVPNPETTVLAFVLALAEGDAARVASLIASKYEPHLERLRNRNAGKAELAETADLFTDAVIAQTVQRQDGNAALVDMHHPERWLSVYLAREGNDWKITTVHARKPVEKE